MDRKKRNRFIIVTGCILAVLLVLIILTGGEKEEEPIKMVMKDAVLHEESKINFFGMMVNPAVISAFTVTFIIFVFSLIVRLFVIPKFKDTPGRFQLILEQAVGIFDGLVVIVEESSSRGGAEDDVSPCLSHTIGEYLQVSRV